MDANKHTIYLTKNHKLEWTMNTPTAALLFNQNGPVVRAQWIKKSIELNNGSFVIMDHKNIIRQEVEADLAKRNYYVDGVDFSNMEDGMSINPFDLVKDTSEIHFLFLNFLYAMWDNADADLPAMSNLIDAFASCIFFMFSNQKSKLNMETMRKMVYSVRATCQTNNGAVPLSDALFASIKDQESMPCKYYAQFKKATGERQAEVAEKVAQVFDMFTVDDMHMMSETDESLMDAFNFKTAMFLNINRPSEEHSAKLMLIMLYYFIQRVSNHSNVLVVLDNINANRGFVSLPHWIKESAEHNMSFIVGCDDLSTFKSTPRAEKFFKNLKKTVTASVLVHQNQIASELANKSVLSQDEINTILDQEYVATVIVPDQEINEPDELL